MKGLTFFFFFETLQISIDSSAACLVWLNYVPDHLGILSWSRGCASSHLWLGLYLYASHIFFDTLFFFFFFYLICLIREIFKIHLGWSHIVMSKLGEEVAYFYGCQLGWNIIYLSCPFNFPLIGFGEALSQYRIWCIKDHMSCFSTAVVALKL